MELRNEVDKLLGDNRTFVRHNKLLMEENANLKAWKEKHRQEMAVMRGLLLVHIMDDCRYFTHLS